MTHAYQFSVPDSRLTVRVSFTERILSFEYMEQGRSTPFKSLMAALMFCEPDMKPAQRLQVAGMLYAEIGKWAGDPEAYSVAQGIRAVEGFLE